MTAATLPDRLLIPYGASRLSPRFFDSVRDAEGRDRLRCRIVHVVIRPAEGEPLRLNNAGDLVVGWATPPGPAGATGRVSQLRAGFEDLCGPWSPLQRRFVTAYFELVVAQVENHRSELESRLVDFGALYHYRDWIYSAPAPLPRAWIPVTETGGAVPPPESFIAGNFVFWTGDALVAVYVTGTETATPARLRNVRRLRDAGVQVHEIPAAALSAHGSDVLRDRLPAAFLRFWEGERYPSGPLRTGMPVEIEDRDP